MKCRYLPSKRGYVRAKFVEKLFRFAGTQNSASLHWFHLFCSIYNNAEQTLCVALLGRNTADNNGINYRGQDTTVTLLEGKV
jgi:hypothetical protein